MADKDLPAPPSSNFVIAGAFSLAFSLGACGDGYYNDGGYLDEGVLDEGMLDEGPLDDGTLDDGVSEEGYLDEGYYDDGWNDDGYYTDSGPTTEPVTSGPGTDSWTSTGIDTSTTDGTASSTTETTDTTGSTGTTDTGTGTTDASTSGTDSSGGDSSGGDTDTGGGDVNFPPVGVFGDDVIEPDLVGTWSLQWTPDNTTWDSVLTIDDSGNFLWRETSADCSSDTLATGVLWVEPGQIVMHVDTWERQLPWDTLGVAGEEFPAPFRLRMSYALLGPNLGLLAPDRIVEAEPYAGRAYLQTDIKGNFIAGSYVGEAELLAAFKGETEPKVIVRDRWTANLDPEPDIVPESTGIVFRDQTYWGLDPPVATPQLFEGGNWTCLYGCTLPAGATLINGGNLYAYGPYAGFQRMMTFASGRSFKRDVDTDCP